MSLLNYVDHPNTNLVCCICRAPFTDPVTTRTCEHTFCRDCVVRALDHADHCPIDRLPLSVVDLLPASPIVRLLVDELVVECVHRTEGCLHTCQRQLLPNHLTEGCAYREVPCPRGKCDEMVVFKDLEAHLHEKDGDSEHTTSAQIQTPTDTKEHESSSADVLSTDTTPLEDAPDALSRVAALTAQNLILRQRVEVLESLVSTFRREMAAVKHTLGPWVQASHVNTTPRYYSTEMPVSVQPATASTSGAAERTAGVEHQQRYQQSFPAYSPSSSSLPADTLAPYFPTEQEFEATYRRTQEYPRTAVTSEMYEYTATHPLVAPLNLSTTLEGTLHGLRESVVGLAAGVDALGRRQEIALTNEAARMSEEVGSLRIGLQGLRMQMHAIMMDRNAQLTGRDGVENHLKMNDRWMWSPPRGMHGQAASTTKL